MGSERSSGPGVIEAYSFDPREHGRRHAIADDIVERIWRELGEDPRGRWAADPFAWRVSQFFAQLAQARAKQAEPGKHTLLDPPTKLARGTGKHNLVSDDDAGPAPARPLSEGGARVLAREASLRAAIRGEVLTIADALALDADQLEIVVDERARTRLASAGVRGLQEGQTVYVHPDVVEGTDRRYLLAHELVHAAQRRIPERAELGPRAAEAEATSLGRAYAAGAALAKPAIGLPTAGEAHDDPEPDDKKLLEHPIPFSRSINMFGASYAPTTAAKWVGGVDKKRQAIASVLLDLVGGSAYSVDLLNQMIAGVGGAGHFTVTSGLDGKATQTDDASAFNVGGPLMLELNKWLTAAPRNLKTSLSAAHIETLERGVDAVDTWADIQSSFPGWMSKTVYAALMGFTQKTLLEKYGKAVHALGDAPSDAAIAKVTAVRTEVLKVLNPPIKAMEAVRIDTALTKEPAYHVLWDLPAVDPKVATDVAIAPEGRASPSQPTFYFLTDAVNDAEIAKRALTSAPARKELLDRFATRLALRKLPTDGDQVMGDGVGKPTRPPLPSTLTSYPQLEAPFFDTPKGGDREFVMNVEFSDVFEAFRGYAYKWELIHVPNNEIEKLAEAADTKTKGESPGQLSVLGGRLARDAEYGSTDIRRSITGIENLLGPPGIGPLTLAGANAALRMVGTVIKTFIETIFKPRYEKTMPFKDDGLYVVRCISFPQPSDKSLIDRSPSVSWLPIWVRPASDMSKLRSNLDAKIQTGTTDRLKEINDKLKETNLDPAERARLQKEKDDITATLGANGGGLLALEKKQLNDALAKETDAGRKEALKKRIDELDEIAKMRTDRLAGAPTDGKLEGVTRIPAAFVGDQAQSMRPLIEVFQKPNTMGMVAYHAVDSTTKNSGHRDGAGATRSDAIADAIRNILESDQGYGRGYCTITIPMPAGQAGAAEQRTIRVDKQGLALAMEAVENLATVASIAAMAAAPFTGGASLALLVPIGIIGAIPSAYRLIDRGQQGTLRFDMAMAMDVVNILGAAVGASQASAAGKAALRGVPLGKGWMILGLGNDGLGMLVAGAGTIDQINEACKDPNMPPGLRNAAIAQIVGNQLVQLGMMVGTQLYMHGKQQAEALGGKKPNETPHPLVEPALQEKFRAEVGEKGKNITVYRDAQGTQVAGDGVHIVYELDGYGLPTDLRVIAGPGAGEKAILEHAQAARTMLEYQGAVGYLRNLLDQVIMAFRGEKKPKPGSRAWEAKIELEKLPKVMKGVYDDLGSGKLAPEAAASKIRDLQEQMRGYEQALSEYGEGKGYVAAHDTVTLEAEKKGYPKAPADHFYYEKGDGTYQLQRTADTDAKPQHVEQKNGKWVLVDGKVAMTVDATAAKSNIAKWLGVAPDKVNVTLNAPLDQVSVRPPATAGGPYEVHVPKGQEAKVNAAIERHQELAAQRPKDIKADPTFVDGNGKKQPWTGRMEAEYLGRPDADPGEYWALNKGKLSYVRSDAEGGGVKRIYDEKSGRLIPDTGARTEPSFKGEKTRDDVFELLGGNDPKNDFGAWVEAAEKYLGKSKDDLKAKLPDYSKLADGETRKYRTVRDDIKDGLRKEFAKTISDPNWLRKQESLKANYEGLKPTDKSAFEKADKAASHQALLELTSELGSGDRGSIAEQWYIKNYASKAAEAHISFTQEEMKKHGIDLAKDRVPDIIDGNKILDIKHVNGPIGADDELQLRDFAKLTEKQFKIGERTFDLKSLTICFTEPVGGAKNAEFISKMIRDNPKVIAEIFNSKGERKTIARSDFNAVKGDLAALSKIITDFAK